jgi:hypothetical protein
MKMIDLNQEHNETFTWNRWQEVQAFFSYGAIAIHRNFAVLQVFPASRSRKKTKSVDFQMRPEVCHDWLSWKIPACPLLNKNGRDIHKISHKLISCVL